jgi:hypothetical protein
MRTYWLTGSEEAYTEHTNISESKTEVIVNDRLSEYHPTMSEINNRRKSLTNVINKLPLTLDQCLFINLKGESFI